MTEEDVHRGAGIYTKPVLGFYDLLVVKLSNSLAWRCPSHLMLEQYRRLLGARHLDIGPGTGWYLARSVDEHTDLWLMDLNANSLETAAARLPEKTTVSTVGGNVLEPLPEAMGAFDSIGVNYLFHCVPGDWSEKGCAFGHLADHLAEDGVLFGSTILGDGVDHNLGGKGLMALYNRMGIFHNRQDDAQGLRAALEESFADVDLSVIGTVAVFSARGPRR